jgi:Transglutaminase-like superfamily
MQEQMKLLGKFFKLPAADKRLLMKAMLLVWVVRLGLWLLPFRVMREVLAKSGREQFAFPVGESGVADRIAWAVSVTSRYVPAATCLTQAIATKFLLGRCGCQATVRIGVARSDSGRLQAHAWVESNGKVVIGGSESSLQHYIPLAASEGDLL